MPKCAGCGADTDLHELDTPMCPGCINKRERSGSELEILRTNLTSARDLYRKGMEDLERHQALCRGLPEGHPDRTISARLEDHAKTAGERYWEALRLYSLALQNEGGKKPGEP